MRREGRIKEAQQPGAGPSGTREAQHEILYLLLVPLEVGDEDKAVRGIWILKNNPLSFSLPVENIVHPLEGRGERAFTDQSLSPGDTPQRAR